MELGLVMDTVKIDNFKRYYPMSDFPLYRTLSPQESERIRRSLGARLGIPDSTSPLDLVKYVSMKSTIIPNFDAEQEDFDLNTLLNSLGIERKENVLVNWYRYDRIDEMTFADLSKYFHDIWYPRADDIDIFDKSLDWILSVGYSGVVSVLRL